MKHRWMREKKVKMYVYAIVVVVLKVDRSMIVISWSWRRASDERPVSFAERAGGRCSVRCTDIWPSFPTVSISEMSTSASRRLTSCHQRCRIHRNSLVPKRVSQAGVLRKIRIHLRQPDELGKSNLNRAG